MEKTLKEFTEEILQLSENRPHHIRKGQWIFNYIEEIYGDVARKVQFIDHVDCFYNDDNIYAFINEVYNRLYN